MAENRNYIYRVGTTPQTRLLNTMRVKVYAPRAPKANELVQIGVMQDWSPSDARTVTAVRGVGFGDQVAEQSVGVTEITGTANVMALYLNNIMQVFGYNAGVSGLVRSLKHHRWPFDVMETIVLPKFVNESSEAKEASGGDSPLIQFAGTRMIVSFFEGCWMTGWTRSYAIGTAEVTESMNCNITDVYSPGKNYEDAEAIADMGTDAEFGRNVSRLFGNELKAGGVSL